MSPPATEPRRTALGVSYVLPQPELSGGIKVALQHATLLGAAGHRVTVLAEGERPGWTDYSGRWIDTRAGLPALETQDLVIATFWTTVTIAQSLSAGPVAHFCQGYEGSHPHLAGRLDEIEEVYRRDLPTLVVSPHLAEFVELHFGRSSRLTPPVLDRRFRPRWRVGPRRRPRIFVPGIFEAEVKGIPLALDAVRRLRAEGLEATVTRASILPLSDQERELLEPDRYLLAVEPQVIADELRRCDLLLFPSRHNEGFGLPVLEAMASGVPVVASRIPSLERFPILGVELVERSPEAFAAAAVALLRSPRRWRAQRRRARAECSRFGAKNVLPALEQAIRWAADSRPAK